MITIKRDNEKVVIEVDTDLANDCAGHTYSLIPFLWNTEQPYLADVLCRYIRKLLQDRVRTIREQEYERGWKDAKSKRAKETWFSSEL